MLQPEKKVSLWFCALVNANNIYLNEFRSSVKKREKAKYAARERRTLEGDFLQELEQMLPFSGPPPSSQQTSLDKTSVIRLSLAGLKCADLLSHGEAYSSVIRII